MFHRYPLEDCMWEPPEHFSNNSNRIKEFLEWWATERDAVVVEMLVPYLTFCIQGVHVIHKVSDGGEDPVYFCIHTWYHCSLPTDPVSPETRVHVDEGSYKQCQVGQGSLITHQCLAFTICYGFHIKLAYMKLSDPCFWTLSLALHGAHCRA